MKEKHKRALLSGAQAATKSGALAAASSILSGLAVVSVPVKILGIITVASSTVVAAPVVATMAISGAVIGGTIAAVKKYRKDAATEEEFKKLANPQDHDRQA